MWYGVWLTLPLYFFFLGETVKETKDGRKDEVEGERDRNIDRRGRRRR